MKLIVITGAVHFDADIEKILDQAGVEIYSRSDISGHKKKRNSDLRENWFAGSNGYQQSVMFFAFTEKEMIDKVIAAVEAFNNELDSESPLRAFVLGVESFH